MTKKITVISVDTHEGLVVLWAVPQWLKGNQAVTAELTPRAARKLAIDLLREAEKAES